jgi:hypothetical protein
MIPGYVYIIEHTITGQFYYGSRTANIRHNRLPIADLWNNYYTSSRDVKRLIKEHGEDLFVARVLFESTDLDKIYWYEQELIKEHINNPKCLNKKYQDKDSGHEVFSTSGKRSWNNGKPSPKKGIPRSAETISKISKNRKGKGLGNPSPNKGVPMSPERYAKQIEAISKRRSYAGENNSFYGKTHSPETRALIAENTSRAQKGRAKPKKPCPSCNELYAANVMARHFRKCINSGSTS